MKKPEMHDMQHVEFAKNGSLPRRILCLGSHSDDIEIGCGGAILKLLDEDPRREIVWVVFSSGRRRSHEAKRSATLFLKDCEKKKVIVQNFRDGFFPYSGEKIKEFFEKLKRKFSPDIVFTHYRDDRHQDHRHISDLTWNTFRDHLILEYEIPKYDGDLGSPNFFMPLSGEISSRKVDIIAECFRTQKDKQWFTRDTLMSLMRLRGVESRSPSKYAEGFYCRKIVL